jgi:long-chain acyl-CoA synthetase
MSETCAIASFNRPDRERKPGSIGIPVPGVEMKAVDGEGNEVPQGEVGEILIRGPVVMKGYWNRDDATAETIDSDGWLHSGDMATVDEDGFFFVVDRKKDMIIRGGFNVYPREIEEVLYEHPAVAEAAVVGVEHESLGEEVAAAVALKDGQDATVDELRA